MHTQTKEKQQQKKTFSKFPDTFNAKGSR